MWRRTDGVKKDAAGGRSEAKKEGRETRAPRAKEAQSTPRKPPQEGATKVGRTLGPRAEEAAGGGQRG